MKNMKKILALVVAVLMIAASMSAMATGSIQLNDSNAGANSHDYKVYQIFTGTLNGEKLENVKYGKNYKTTGASVPKTELDAITDAEAFAKSVESQVTGAPFATIKANTKLENVPDGYYLIVDDTSKELTEGDAYSRYMIQVVKAVEIAVKKSGTTSDKEIDKDTLGEEERDPDADKMDNVSIGDTVTFKLTATVASDADTYNKYFFVMNDTLDEGFTFNKDTAAITVTASNKGGLTENTDYTVYTGDDCDGTPKHTLEIALLNAKELAGQTITVTYKAVLNENCEIHEIPNKNTFYVTYSNNPKHDYNGETDDNKPGKPSSTSKDAFGETPDQHTETFTTGIKIKKVDQDNVNLAGATFSIEGDSLETVVYYTEEFVKADDPKNTEHKEAEYYELKNGSFTTEAPTARQMKAQKQAEGVGYVLWQNGDEEEKVTVGGTDYRVARSNEKGQFILETGNADLYKTGNKEFVKIETKHTGTKTNKVSQTLTVGADGILKFDGLGAGTYTIKEIAAPEGYTKIDHDLTVKITFVVDETSNNGKHWKDEAGDDATIEADGYYTVTVQNVAGNTLPSTGGMGTTILYIGGSILVLAAAILLITKRRMNAED